MKRHKKYDVDAARPRAENREALDDSDSIVNETLQRALVYYAFDIRLFATYIPITSIFDSGCSN